MIKAVFFDLDDTLLNDRKSIQTAFDVTCEELAHKYNLDAKVIEEKVRTVAREQYKTYPFYEFTTEIGMNPFEGLWGNFTDIHHYKFREMGENILDYQTQTWVKGLKDFNISEDNALKARDRFKEVRRQSPFLFEETIEVLDTLQKDGKRLLLLTNGSPTLQFEKLSLTPELIPYFEHIVVSGNIGYGKPSPVIFAHSIRLMDLKAAEIVMVGDNPNTDIIGASQVGIDTIWIDLNVGNENKDVHPTHTVKRLRDILPLIN